MTLHSWMATLNSKPCCFAPEGRILDLLNFHAQFQMSLKEEQ